MGVKKLFTDFTKKLGAFDVVGWSDLQMLSKKHSISIRDAEIAALSESVVPSRYISNVRFIGVNGQLKLLGSTATIVGCGALGGMLCELLARLGVGHLKLIDFDKFDETNLNRQIMCTEEDLGKSKVSCAKERISKINSAITATAYEVRLDEANAVQLISNSDVVLDGLDNAKDKITLEAACLNEKIPLVHGAIGDSRFQIASIRNRGLLENLYASGTENPVAGTPPCTAAACAAMQAGEMLKLLLGIGDIATDAILQCDWLFWHSNIIRL